MEEERKAANFIEAEINKDIENHVYANDRVLTRFPPEPKIGRASCRERV